MPPRGRKPDPTILKLRRGTARSDRQVPREARPALRKPTAPRWLPSYARAEWRRVVDEMHDLGLVSRLDRAVLAGYCLCWAHLRDCERDIERHGQWFVNSHGNPTLAPWAIQARSLRDQLRMYSAELGLTASSRSRINVAPSPAEPSEDEQFFGTPSGTHG